MCWSTFVGLNFLSLIWFSEDCTSNYINIKFESNIYFILTSSFIHIYKTCAIFRESNKTKGVQTNKSSSAHNWVIKWLSKAEGGHLWFQSIAFFSYAYSWSKSRSSYLGMPIMFNVLAFWRLVKWSRGYENQIFLTKIKQF